MSSLDLNTYYGKISKLSRAFNKLDPTQVRDAIEIAQMNVNKDISKVNLKRKEPIEYVVEESKQAEIIPLNRKNIENIQERASGGEER